MVWGAWAWCCGRAEISRSGDPDTKARGPLDTAHESGSMMVMGMAKNPSGASQACRHGAQTCPGMPRVKAKGVRYWVARPLPVSLVCMCSRHGTRRSLPTDSFAAVRSNVAFEMFRAIIRTC